MERAKLPEQRILIVDDVETNRFLLRDIIMDMGYQPVLAESGAQAAKIFPVCSPQLVLLDISMPEMNGFELCRILKENPDTREVPVIFISAMDEAEDIVRGFEVGGEDYITKPFIPEVIKARVGVHLKLSAATRNLSELNRQLMTSVDEQLAQMEQEKKSVLYAMANVAREHAMYDERQMERLGCNCRILAQAMQLSDIYGRNISDTYIEGIELAAPLCDVGNVAVPMEVLQKESALTPEEMKLVMRHTTVGAKVLEDIHTKDSYNEYVQMAVDIARFHHENWDGSGYPQGRKGDGIPLAAQIVSLVSAYCALTADRPYRKAFTGEEALAIMEEDAGIRYNPDILYICQKIHRQLH